MNIASLTMALLPGWLVFTLLYAILVKLVERRLKFTQSLLLSVAATATWIALRRVSACEGFTPSERGFRCFRHAIRVLCRWHGSHVACAEIRHSEAWLAWPGSEGEPLAWVGMSGAAAWRNPCDILFQVNL
jgi:hypothetical protein